jgi:hypothetical protein
LLLYYSPTLERCQLNSVKHLSSFTLNSNNGQQVSELLVSNEGLLLVDQLGNSQLQVYSANFFFITSITLASIHTVTGAVWTRQGNILYSRFDSGIVVTMSQSGDVIQQSNVSQPTALSVSTDGVIYIVSGLTSVYQSTDDGLTWSHMFIVSDGWRCSQVIKVSTDSNTDALWTVNNLVADNLRVYTVDKRRVVGDNVSWHDVTLPSHVTKNLSIDRLAYDGYTSIFITDLYNRAVHVLSVSGQYDGQLEPRQQLPSSIHCVAVDAQRHVLYVGQEYGTVGVFQLTYKPL